MSDRTETPIPRRPARTRRPTESRQASLLYLMGLLTHDDPRVRRRAARALGRLQDAEALDSLVMTLQDGDRLVQQAAIGALGAIGDPRAIPPLRQLHPRVDRRLRATIEDAQRSITSRQVERPKQPGPGTEDASVRHPRSGRRGRGYRGVSRPDLRDVPPPPHPP